MTTDPDTTDTNTERAEVGAGDPHLQVRDLAVQRGGVPVLEIDSLDIRRGRVTVVIGPNGCGKSTLLGALQLVLHPTRGTLLLDGAPMHANPVQTRRRMSAAFQEPLLLSMSVLGNVELPLRLRGVTRRRRRAQAEHWLQRFGIAPLAGRHAQQLSGGEAQRVSLARAFASQPEVMLLDEPFAGVDAPTREGLIADFADILAETRPTTVLVTHDRDEALRLGDDCALLIDGRVRQTGAPAEIFDRPADREVAEFVGIENIVPRERWPWPLDAPPGGLVCVRSEQIGLTRGEGAVIQRANLVGAMVRVVVDVDGVELVAQVSRPLWSRLDADAGDAVAACVPPEAIHVLPERGALTSPEERSRG